MRRETENFIKKLNESASPEADEKVGGDYNDFIDELMNARQTMVDLTSEMSTHLAEQIMMDTVQKFDEIIFKYEQEKDIEISGAME